MEVKYTPSLGFLVFIWNEDLVVCSGLRAYINEALNKSDFS